MKKHWKKLEEWGKNHPVLLAIAILAFSSLSLFWNIFIQLLQLIFTFVSNHLFETLIVMWLAVITFSISKIRNALANGALHHQEESRTEAADNSQYVSEMDALDALLIATLADTRKHSDVGKLYNDIFPAFTAFNYQVSGGELVFRLKNLQKYGIVKMSWDEGWVWITDAGRAFYFKQQDSIKSIMSKAEEQFGVHDGT